jgi:hypothetical protein
MFIFRLLVVGLLLLTIGFSTGCSKKSTDPVRGVIAGKVTVKGGPLTGGNLIFQKDGKEVANLQIDSNGTFNGSVPLGELKVGVDTERIKMEAGQQGKGIDPNRMKELMAKYQDKNMTPEEKAKMNAEAFVEAKYVPIPEKYRDPGKSGFTVTIQAGKNEKDFPIP